MKNIEDKTKLNATAEKVYETLMDFENWPEWNPMITSICGGSSVGSKLKVTVKIGDAAPQNFEPIVLKNEKNREFRWKGVLGFGWLFSGEHYFIIDNGENEENRESCTLIHGEDFSGVAQPLLSVMSPLLGPDAVQSFVGLNQAFKERVENTQ